jgi:hypothetical protein
MPAIRHHHVEIDGLKVFVREAGDAARPTLVLLPGYPSSTRLIYEIDGQRGAAWSYKNAWAEVSQIAGFISFEADKVNVSLDDKPLKPQQGQTVNTHGVDRDLTVAELERKVEL